VPVPYDTLVQQFRAAPPGKLYLLHGGEAVFRLSLSAAAHVLLQGVPLTLVDGSNRFDLYAIADAARTFSRHGGRHVTPEDLLRRIFVSRAFTCYQMEALVTDRLPAFVRRVHSPIVLVFGLLDTFYDEQAPLFEARAGLQRSIAALQSLKQGGVAVLLASLDIRPASADRRVLFPQLAAAMDLVCAVQEDGGMPVIERGRQNMRLPAARKLGTRGGERHGTHSADVYNGHPAGDGKLVKVPAGAPPGRPGGAGRSVPRGANATCGKRLRREADPL
jgi:hypothetical protein